MKKLKEDELRCGLCGVVLKGKEGWNKHKLTKQHKENTTPEKLREAVEFYYVCPWGLIEKAEVPETSGLMYVNQNKGITIIKPAMLRELHDIPFHLFQGFAREFGNKDERLWFFWKSGRR